MHLNDDKYNSMVKYSIFPLLASVKDVLSDFVKSCPIFNGRSTDSAGQIKDVEHGYNFGMHYST